MYSYFRDDEKYFLYKKQIDEYRDYKEKYLPEWYKNFKLHDSHIVNIEYLDDELILTVEHDMFKHPKFQICFYEYKVVEDCDIIDSWIIEDELYINYNENEFHLLVDTTIENHNLRAYFTIRFKKMEMIFNDLICTIGDKVEDLHNPKLADDIYNALQYKNEFYKNASFYGSKIIDYLYDENKLILFLTSFSRGKKYKITFWHFKIIKNCNLINSIIISNDLYIQNSNNSLFLIIKKRINDRNVVEKFEITFSKIEICFHSASYLAGDGVDESSNLSRLDLSTLFFSDFK